MATARLQSAALHGGRGDNRADDFGRDETFGAAWSTSALERLSLATQEMILAETVAP